MLYAPTFSKNIISIGLLCNNNAIDKPVVTWSSTGMTLRHFEVASYASRVTGSYTISRVYDPLLRQPIPSTPTRILKLRNFHYGNQFQMLLIRNLQQDERIWTSMKPTRNSVTFQKRLYVQHSRTSMSSLQEFYDHVRHVLSLKRKPRRYLKYPTYTPHYQAKRLFVDISRSLRPNCRRV